MTHQDIEAVCEYEIETARGEFEMVVAHARKVYHDRKSAAQAKAHDAHSALGVEPSPENVDLLNRLDGWKPGAHNTGTLIRWAAAHLRGELGAIRQDDISSTPSPDDTEEPAGRMAF